MAPCCIKGCDNRGEKRSKKNSGITYHLFPRDAVRRRSWLQALGRGGDWQPSNSTVVCSEHFLPSHFYITAYGLKRLRDEATPAININITGKCDDIASSAEGECGVEALAAMLAGGAAPGVTLDASDSPATRALAAQLLHLTLIYEKQKKKLRNLRQSLRRHDAKLQSMENPLAKVTSKKLPKDHKVIDQGSKVRKKERKKIRKRAKDTFKIVLEDRDILETHESGQDPLNI